MARRTLATIVSLALAFASMVAAPASAGPVRGVEPAVERAIAVRGGVLMLPLRARRPGTNWPATLTVALEGGRTIEGTVAWVHPLPQRPQRPWTTDPRGLGVRPILPGDDSAQVQSGAPWLLARLPADGAGPLRIERQAVSAIWCDRPVPLEGASRAALVLEERLDRPDPTSPFESWRWALLADRLGAAPPAPSSFGESGGLLAEHQGDLWRIGLERLRAARPAAAGACLELLTRICRDRGRAFAAWLSDAQQTAALLSILVDFQMSEHAMVSAVEAWTAAQEPLVIWLESAGPSQVSVVMINRSDRAQVARFTWLGRGEVPIAVELAEGVLTLAIVDRPPPEAPRPIERARSGPADPAVLEIAVGARTFHLQVPPPVLAARPPAVFNATLRPPLTLAQAEAGVGAVDPARATYAHLRRVEGRWEVFFDCRRPGARLAPRGDLEGGSGALPLGLEAVSVYLGEESGDGEGTALRVMVPEVGPPRIDAAARAGEPQVHVRSYADRWLCRIVLPDGWLPRGEGEHALVGCARTFGDSGGFQTAPATTTSWRRVMGRSAIDLGAWEE